MKLDVLYPPYTRTQVRAPHPPQWSAAASGESQRCLRDAGGATGLLRERPRPRTRPGTPRPFLNGAGSHHTAAAAVQLRAQLSGMGVLERVRLRGRAPHAGKRRWAGAPRLALRNGSGHWPTFRWPMSDVARAG